MKLFKQNKYYFLIISVIGILVYFPILFNGFVWDDVDLIINNPSMHSLNFMIFFDNGYNANIYRLVTVFYYSLIYSIFGPHAFPYHLIQLLLHIFVSCLLLILFRKAFSSKLSLFLALLFLVHPINSDAVLWISASHTEILTIFGLSTFLLSMDEKISNKRLVFISFLTLLCMMTYELGFIYLIILLIFRYIFKLNEIKRFVIHFGFVILIYIFLRYIANTIGFNASNSPLNDISLLQRFNTIPAIIFYYLTTLLFPLRLYVLQRWIIDENTFWKVYFPLLIDIVFLIINILFLNFIYYKKHTHNIFQWHLFFIFWFLLFFIPYLQIFPLDRTVANDWFYYSFIGILGILGIVINNFKSNKYLVTIAVLVLVLLSGRTFTRTFDWKDELTLFTHDIQYEQDNEVMLNNLILDLQQKGRIREAMPYQEKLVAVKPDIVTYNQLGLSYQKLHMYKEAINSFNQAIILTKQSDPSNLNFIPPYLNLAKLYFEINEPEKVINLLSDSVITTFSRNPDLLFLKAKANVQLGRYDKAQPDIDILYKYSVNSEVDKLYKQIHSGN